MRLTISDALQPYVTQFAESARSKFTPELLARMAAADRSKNPLGGVGESLATLALAEHLGTPVPADLAESLNDIVIPFICATESINGSAGPNHDPRWSSDLHTADAGAALAIASKYGSSLAPSRPALQKFVREKCLTPILKDWLHPQTRIHSLDSMGHNWWCVLVAGAGIISACLEEHSKCAEIAGRLKEWFKFPGNEFSRKLPNFGPEGDYVEGTLYFGYGLLNLMGFSLHYPAFQLKDCLSVEQFRGLARWLKLSVAATHPPTVFPIGDTHFHHVPRAETWHTIAEIAQDTELLALAHAMRPEPRTMNELFFWHEKPAGPITPFQTESPAIFPTSGFAMIKKGPLHLVARAGDFWGHNHNDAGSFIYHHGETTWLNESGTCTYGRPIYTEHYMRPMAHNVAYAPDLVPPRIAFFEGLHSRSRFVLSGGNEELQFLLADTGTLSGFALARSYRLLLNVGETLLVWDDLQHTSATPFTHRLHTMHQVERTSDSSILLKRAGQQCAVNLYSPDSVSLKIESAPMGEDHSRKTATGWAEFEGQRMSWTTAPLERAKFGLTVGPAIKSTKWSANEAGWTCELENESGVCTIWFNLRADGRVMHDSPIARFRGYETDAYALVLTDQNVHAIHSSFVRSENAVLISNLARQPLASASR